MPSFYGAIALTGGAAGALDDVDGTGLNDGDGAIVKIPTSGEVYEYTLDADSGATESSPNVIAPDANAGNKRWLLCPADSNKHYVNPSAADQGASTHKSIKALVDAIGATKKATLVLAHNGLADETTYTVSTVEYIPANISVVVEEGAIIHIDTGITLLIYGNFKAGLCKVFDCAGTGKVRFAGNAGGVPDPVSKTLAIYPQWWGATGDNSTDDTAAIEAAIIAANHAYVPIHFPTGTYRAVCGSLSEIAVDVYGPEATIGAYDSTAGVLLHFMVSGQFIDVELKAVIGYDVPYSYTFDDTITIAATTTGVLLNRGFYSRFKIHRIVGFTMAFALNSTTGGNDYHIANHYIQIDEIRHNDYGIYALSGATQRVEANRFEIGYFYDNRIAAIKLDGTTKIVSNFFSIIVLEPHTPTNTHGIVLTGEVYRNTFRIFNFTAVTGTGKLIQTTTAHNNLFQLACVDFADVSMDASNVFDTHTMGISDTLSNRSARSMVRASAQPSDGRWRDGDIVWNDSPSDGILGWFAGEDGLGGSIQWGKIWSRPEEAITVAGACSTVGLTKVNTTAGAMAITLADGTHVGQIKEFTMIADAGDATLTVASHETSSPEVFTLNDNYDYLNLVWVGNVWATVKNYGVATP